MDDPPSIVSQRPKTRTGPWPCAAGIRAVPRKVDVSRPSAVMPIDGFRHGQRSVAQSGLNDYRRRNNRRAEDRRRLIGVVWRRGPRLDRIGILAEHNPDRKKEKR